MTRHGRPGEVGGHGEGYSPPAVATVVPFTLLSNLSAAYIFPGNFTMFATELINDPKEFGGFEIKRSADMDTEYGVSITFDCADAPPGAVPVTVRSTTPVVVEVETSIQISDPEGFCGVV